MRSHRYKIIIVDDEIRIVQLIKHLISWDTLPLTLIGTANDGLSALELIKEGKPDIVILDIRMPGYNGIELISKAREENPQINFIIVSGYRHFEYAHMAIKFGVEDYLLKPVKEDEINQTLKKIIEKKQNNSRMIEISNDKNIEEFLIEIFQMGNKNAMTLEQCCSRFNLDLKQIHLELILIKNDLNTDELNENERTLLEGKTKTVISNCFDETRIGYCTYISEHGTFLLLNYSDRDEKAIRNYLINIIEGLHSLRDLFSNLNTTIARSGKFDDLQNIQIIMDSLNGMIQDRIFQGIGKILEKRPVGKNRNVKEFLTISIKNEIIKKIGIFDFEGIEQIVQNLFHEVKKESQVSGDFVLALLNELIGTISYQFENQFEITLSQKNKLSTLKVLLKMQSTLQSMVGLTLTYIKTVLLENQQERNTRDDKPIVDAKKYINENFFLPLTLEEVSDSIGISSTYLSSLFKKKTGIGFIDYLTQVRMDEAKELLSDPKRSVTDTASEVGYKDPKHFTKQFKKKVGLSPAEYRKIYY
jgi:two-component system response regulator YesN